MKSNIKLSIITINYNNAEGLKKTLDSVAGQTQHDFEHIVIDGDSTDASKEVVKSFNYSSLSWVSEPDSGIYNAMNKGIVKAKGEYLLFLNSGDYLKKDTILSDVKCNLSLGKDIIYGNIETVDKLGKRKVLSFPDKLSLEWLVDGYLPHPATFYKKELFIKHGKYNEKNKIISDWEFNLKVLTVGNASYQYINKTITVFDLTGVSSLDANLNLKKEEGRQAMINIFGITVANFILENIANNKNKKKQSFFKYFKNND